MQPFFAFVLHFVIFTLSILLRISTFALYILNFLNQFLYIVNINSHQTSPVCDCNYLQFVIGLRKQTKGERKCLLY